MPVPHFVEDATIATESQAMAGLDNTIADAVANGRLYVLNGRGEMERVELFTSWRDGNLYTVCAPSGQTMPAGYEFDEDGTVTRNWAVDS